MGRRTLDGNASQEYLNIRIWATLVVKLIGDPSGPPIGVYTVPALYNAEYQQQLLNFINN